MKTPPLDFSRRRFLRRAALTAAALGWRPAAWAADAPAATSGNQTGTPSAPPAKKLGVALCGLGGYATGELAPALQQTKNCRLAGVVTGSPATKGAQWAAKYGFPEKNIYTYDTMAKLADNPDIDIVYVVTPNVLHAGHVIAAARAGKHVITEKPMAGTVAQCDAMLAACRAAQRTLAVGYRLNYDPYHLALARLGQDPAFGPFLELAGENGFTLHGQQWRIEKKLSGGGPLMDMGIYVVHATCVATGLNPTAVTAKQRVKTQPAVFSDVEEALDWTLEFANGAKAECQTSYVQNNSHFQAKGPHGWMDFNPAFGYNGIKVNTSTGPLVFPPMTQQAAHMDGIAQCIRDGRDTPVSGEVGRRDLVIVEGIYASANANGRRVELKYDVPTTQTPGDAALDATVKAPA